MFLHASFVELLPEPQVMSAQLVCEMVSDVMVMKYHVLHWMWLNFQTVYKTDQQHRRFVGSLQECAITHQQMVHPMIDSRKAKPREREIHATGSFFEMPQL